MPQLASSLVSGFMHPVHGADHLVAMLAVGVWGAIAGGRATRVWPIAFVATMLAGFTMAASGIALPLVEPATRSSLVILGLAIALALNAPLWCGAAVIGLFALFHGHAHGTEAVTASLIAYASGLAMATGALHALGIGLCRIADNPRGRITLRVTGAIAAVGAIVAMVA